MRKSKKKANSTSTTLHFNLLSGKKIKAFIYTEQKLCCDKNYYLVTTKAERERNELFSCQCMCGKIETNFHPTMYEAIAEYKYICDRVSLNHNLKEGDYFVSK